MYLRHSVLSEFRSLKRHLGCELRLHTIGSRHFFEQGNTMTHVVYGVDNKYVPCLLVSMYSVLATASGPTKITVFTVGQHFNPSEIHNLAAHFPSSTLDVREFETEPLLSYETTEQGQRYTSASMIPLFIPWLIDEKCIFLDADTLILKDISQLYSANLYGNLIGATPAWECRKILYFGNEGKRGKWSLRSPQKRKRMINLKREFIEHAKLLGYTIEEYEEECFSSGVVLFDTKEIRRADPSAMLMNIEESKKHWDNSPDQSRLNEYFKNNVHFLDVKWNLYREIPFNRNPAYLPGDLLNQIRSATRNPSILHYSNIFDRRPWARPWYIPSRKRYRIYKQICKQIEAQTGIRILQMFNSRN